MLDSGSLQFIKCLAIAALLTIAMGIHIFTAGLYTLSLIFADRKLIENCHFSVPSFIEDTAYPDATSQTSV